MMGALWTAVDWALEIGNAAVIVLLTVAAIAAWCTRQRRPRAR